MDTFIERDTKNKEVFSSKSTYQFEYGEGEGAHSVRIADDFLQRNYSFHTQDELETYLDTLFR